MINHQIDPRGQCIDKKDGSFGPHWSTTGALNICSGPTKSVRDVDTVIFFPRDTLIPKVGLDDFLKAGSYIYYSYPYITTFNDNPKFEGRRTNT